MTGTTTRITVETETQLVIRRAKAILDWCPYCRAEVDVIALEEDSFATSVTGAQVQNWVATSKLHFWRIASGPAQICLPSLFRCFELEQLQRLFRSENPQDQSRRKSS